MPERPWRDEPTTAALQTAICTRCRAAISLARSLCKPCYQQARKDGTLPLAKDLRPALCVAPGCLYKPYARDLCRTCYQRWWRTGETGGARPRRTHRDCTTEGCGREHWARGKCHTCYQRERRAQLRAAR